MPSSVLNLRLDELLTGHNVAPGACAAPTLTDKWSSKTAVTRLTPVLRELEVEHALRRTLRPSDTIQDQAASDADEGKNHQPRSEDRRWESRHQSGLQIRHHNGPDEQCRRYSQYE